MKNGSFKKIKAVSALGTALAAIIIAFACICPTALLRGLKRETERDSEECIRAVLADDPARAAMLLSDIRETLLKYRSQLLTTFDHDEIEELFYAVDTAYELALAGDKAQLLTELTAFRTKLEFLLYTNRAGLENLL